MINGIWVNKTFYKLSKINKNMNRVIILLMTSIIITFECLSISQISFSHQPVTMNITKLTGKEKIELVEILK